MTDRRLVTSGDMVAGRYELHDLVTEGHGCARWRARDVVLNRNVGVEMLPVDDPRTDGWLEAARASTRVTDPRFLRVMDLLHDHAGHQIIVREWARAFSLEQILGQSPLTSRRAATVVSEVAEAIAHAHEAGMYHQRLSPHQVLLKQSGAVRIVGLGVAAALDPPDDGDGQAREQRDVYDLGRLLYAALTSRWPGGFTDGLEAAPTEHGRLLRPRQVRAGISRDVDTVCDRILSQPPRHQREPLRSANDIAHQLRLSGLDEHTVVDPSPNDVSSPDLLRLDPVIEPSGPPPGLAPPRRRPKAFDEPALTPLERSKATAVRATKGHRLPVLLALVVALAIVGVLAFFMLRLQDGENSVTSDSAVRTLPVSSVYDIDPYGNDSENPDDVDFVIDGDESTSWSTMEYYGSPEFGGLKPGVGLVLDLGGLRDVSSVRVHSSGGPTGLQLYATGSEEKSRPNSVRGLRKLASVADAGADSSITLSDGVSTRYLVVWIRSLPHVHGDTYQATITNVSVRGSAG